MTEIPTDAELDAIEQRANAATPGLWAAVGHSHPLPGCRCLSCDEPTVGWMLDTPAALDCAETVAARTASGARNENGDELGCCEVGPLLSWADVEFASHASQDVPLLLAAVRQLQQDNDELRALFDVQWKRSIEATERWRAEDPEHRALIMPDLGKLLRWLMDDADRARTGGYYLGRCGDETEPDGVICTGELYAKLGDAQVKCPECGGWEGVLASGRREYTEAAERRANREAP